MVRPELVGQLADEPRQRPPAPDHHLDDEQADEQAVAFGDMALDGHPARLLPADEHVLLEDRRADVLEADRRRDHGQAVDLTHPVDHVRRRKRLDERPAEALLDVHVLDEEG